MSKEKPEKVTLPEGTEVPKHVVIIPDGNRRWARERGMKPWLGHKHGTENTKKLMYTCQDWGIQYLTLWGWSTENWDRDIREVQYIMKMFVRELLKTRDELLEKGVRFRHIGQRGRFSEALRNELKALEDATKHCTKFYVNIGLDYGGRNEILRAMKKMLLAGVRAKDLTEDVFASFLDTAGQPDPDFIIRTSGEQRMSGMLPWQSVYAEYYFAECYYPDFTPEKLREAIIEYSRRQRRFGG